MSDFILIVTPLLFLILGVLFLHKYFNKQAGDRIWLYLWYGIVFFLVTVYMYFYILLKELFFIRG